MEINLNRSNNRRGIASKIVREPWIRGKDKAKLNVGQKEEITQRIIEWILEGRPQPEILGLIKVYLPSHIAFNETNCRNYLEFAKRRIQDLSEEDAAVTIAVHIDKYEKIYRYFVEIGNVQGQNKAMRFKERLLGLLKDRTSLVINQKKKTKVTKAVKDVTYDLGRLTQTERDRLEVLMSKITK